jgi:pyruvate formate lyase activating enzyme
LKTGRVFNIQKYSVHDGPGIRTTVFLKGCPLNCWWCHNPESKEHNPVVLFRPELCLGCRSCLRACGKEVLRLQEEKLVRDGKKCVLCGSCAAVCPTEAMEFIGQEMTADQVLQEIEKDRIFYDQSGGGVTFSGGESLLQHQFLEDVLSKCKSRGIRTAIDTSGFAPWEVIAKLSKNTDLFLYDIKHMDGQRHKEFTGVDNVTILENLKRLSLIHKNINIRIPIIPDINDYDDNILSIGDFVKSLGLNKINILPYHNIGIDKYKRLGEEYKLKSTLTPSRGRMEEIKKALEGLGLIIKIGG